MEYRDRIILDPAIRSGKPTLRGTRITVTDVLEYLAGGMTPEAILETNPERETALAEQWSGYDPVLGLGSPLARRAVRWKASCRRASASSITTARG